MRLITIILIALISPCGIAEQIESPGPNTAEQAANQESGNEQGQTDAEASTALHEPTADPNTATPDSGADDEKIDQEWLGVRIAHHDMLQQASMADSTFWMMVISGVAAGFSLAALIGLYFTFMETRRTADAAVATARQDRAWILPKRNAPPLTSEYGSPIKFKLVVPISNFGRTPAIDIRVWYRVETDPTGGGEDLLPIGYLGPSEEFEVPIGFSRWDSTMAALQKRNIIVFRVRVFYKTIYDDLNGETTCAYEIAMHPNVDNEIIDWVPIEHSSGLYFRTHPEDCAAI